MSIIHKGLGLKNLYKILPKEFLEPSRTYDNYNKVKIQIPFQMLIIGKTGSGKTMSLFHIITAMKCFTRFYLYAKDLEEPLYRFFVNQLENMIDEGSNVLTFSTDIKDIPSVDEFDKSHNNLIIIDDMMTERNLSPVIQLFSRGRKKNISIVYISQGYYQIPKTIRQNANYCVVKELTSSKDLRIMLKEHSMDYTGEQLTLIHRYCLSGDDNFLLLDLKDRSGNLTYRKNFQPIRI